MTETHEPADPGDSRSPRHPDGPGSLDDDTAAALDETVVPADDDNANVNENAESTLETGHSVTRRAVRSFLWAALSTGGSRLATVINFLVIPNLLGPTEYGAFAAAQTVLALFEVGLDLGVGAALVYEQQKGITRRVQSAFTLNLLVTFAFCGLGIALGPTLASLFKIPQYTTLFMVLPLYLLVRGIGQINDSLLQRDLEYQRRTIVDLTRAVVRVGLSITLAFLGYGPWALVIGYISGDLIATILFWVLKPFRPTFRLHRDDARSLVRYGIGIVGQNSVNEIAANSDYFIVPARQGATALGYYKFGFQVPDLLISNVLWVFASVAFPTYSKARDLGADALRSAMLRSLRIVTLYAFPMAVGIALAARDVIGLVYGPRWASSVPVMEIIAFALATNSVTYASGVLLNAIGRPWLVLAVNIPYTILLVGCFWIAAGYSIVAVAAVHLVSACIYATIRMVLANRLTTTSWSATLRSLRPAATTSLGIAAFALPARLGMAPGLGSLAAIVALGVIGAIAGLALGGRDAIRDARSLVRIAAGRD